jgi:hypothetical protein
VASSRLAEARTSGVYLEDLMHGRVNHGWLAAIALAAAAGCSESMHPVGSGDMDLTVARDVANACVAVSGTLVEAFAGADLPNNIFYFTGPLSGDLVGTSTAVLTSSDNPAGDPPSPVVFGAGIRTLTVAGSASGRLDGAVLVFELEQTNFQQPPTVRDSERMRLVAGARGGHLTIHGVFDFSTFSLTATYRGSVCP